MNTEGTCSGCRDSAGLNCEYSDAELCSGNGEAQDNGNCVCNPGFTGPATGRSCYFGSAANCSGHGTPNYIAPSEGSGDLPGYPEAVSCTCDPVDRAVPGVLYQGGRCEFSDLNRCNGNGVVDRLGNCRCNAGYLGEFCAFSRQDSCSGHGEVSVAVDLGDGSGDGSGIEYALCACDADGSGGRYGGPLCECTGGKTGYGCVRCDVGYASSSAADGSGVAFDCLRCPGAGPDGPCSGWNVCNPETDGSGVVAAVCNCPTGYYGRDCRLTAADCNDNGTPSDAVGSPGVSCDCYPGWSGEACADVVVPVPPCSGRGALLEGLCLCEQGWEGEVCDAPTCGNGQLDAGEGCDVEAPGCTVDCLVERGYNCGLEGRSCIEDRDLDAVADDSDNCPEEPNTDQADGDSDGLGDECDPYVPVVEEDTAGDTEVDTGIDAPLDSSPPVTSEPPSGCSAGGNGSGWLAGLFLLALALLRGRRAGASRVLVATVGMAGLCLAGCDGSDVGEEADAGAAAVDTGRFGEVAPQPPKAEGAAGSGSPESVGPGLGDLTVDGEARRAGNIEFVDYRPCDTNTDCPNGMGSCVKEVALNRAGDGSGEAGGGAIAVNRMPGFTGLLEGQGICTLGCTDHAEVCGALRYGDDTTPWSCQLTFKSDSPYKTVGAAPLPQTLDLAEMTAGIQYAAVCRPPFARSTSYNRDFCEACTTAAPCFAQSACIDVAPNAPGAPEERVGMCLSPCGVGDVCPSGFECRELTPADKAIGARPQAGGYCAPVAGACGACLDPDGDGVGVGSCSAQGTASGVDCDESDPKRYFDAVNPDHAFPTDSAGCSPLKDANCNGVGDDREQIEAKDALGNLTYGAKFCGSCEETCEGIEGSGEGTATKVCEQYKVDTAAGEVVRYQCSLSCDNPLDQADCFEGSGCETPTDDPSRLFVRDCDGDGEADASARNSDIVFTCEPPTSFLEFEGKDKIPSWRRNDWVTDTTSANAHTGDGSLRSSNRGGSNPYMRSLIEYRVQTVADSTLRFWYKTNFKNAVSSFVVDVTHYISYDYEYQFFSDENETDWKRVELPVKKGYNVIKFSFTTPRIIGPAPFYRFGPAESPDDAVWIDDLELPVAVLLKSPVTDELVCPAVPAVAREGGRFGADCVDTDPTVKPGLTEVCDGRDNNCDGTGDLGVAGVGDACDTGRPNSLGLCHAGRLVCNPGASAAPICAPSEAAVEEEADCDGEDEDCDGSVDDLLDGTTVNRPFAAPVELGEACTVEGALGVCAAGKWACKAGGVVCQGPTPLPTASTPDPFGDEIDQNCDGIDGSLANAIFVKNGGATVQTEQEDQTYGFETGLPSSFANFEWSTNGTALPAGSPSAPDGNAAPWALDSSTAYSSRYSLKSGPVGNATPGGRLRSTMTLPVTLTGPGRISFYVRGSTEPYYDFFRFAVNGVDDTTVAFSGTVSWRRVVRLLPAGNSTVTFTFDKDDSVAGDQDAVWIDNIVISGPNGAVLGSRENPIGNMTAALALRDSRATTANPVKQIHVAGSSDPYPMPYGLRLNGTDDANFAIVGGYDVNLVGSGAAALATWIPGTGATRLVFGNVCPKNAPPNVCSQWASATLAQDRVVAAIGVNDPTNIVFRKVGIEVPQPPDGFGSVAGVSCKTSSSVRTCRGLVLDRVEIRMVGGAGGLSGNEGRSYPTRAEDGGARGSYEYAGAYDGIGGCTRGRFPSSYSTSFYTILYGSDLSVLYPTPSAWSGVTEVVSAGAYGEVLASAATLTDEEAARAAGKRGGTPVREVAGGAAPSGGLPFRPGSSTAGSVGNCGGGGGGSGAGGSVYTSAGYGGSAGGFGGGAGQPGVQGGSVFGLISYSIVDLPTMLMTGIQMGPGGAGGGGGAGGAGQQGGWATPIRAAVDTTTGKIIGASFIAAGGPGGSGGGGGGGAGGNGGWSVGVAKPATVALPFSMGVSVSGSLGRGGLGGVGGIGGTAAPMPSYASDAGPMAPMGAMGANGFAGGSLSTCAMGSPGPGDVACY